jgi:hypothetical protein
MGSADHVHMHYSLSVNEKKKKKRASATQQGQNPKLLAAVFKISFRNLMSFNFPKVGLAMLRHTHHPRLIIFTTRG